MDVWQIALFGVAALLALRSLTVLSTVYKNRLLRERNAQQPHPEKPKPQPQNGAAA